MPARATNSDSTDGQIIISYSHRDARWLEDLTLHLNVLRGDSSIIVWNDQEIGAGSKWRTEIQTALAAAKVAVFLVSANFLTSRFILNEEVPYCLEQYEKGKLRIMPIILRACLWQQVPWLAALQVRPANGRVFGMWNRARQEREWTGICDEIYGWMTGHAPVEPPVAVSGHGVEAVAAPQTELTPRSTAKPTQTEMVRNTDVAGNTVRQLAAAAADSPAVEEILERFRADFTKTSRDLEAITDLKDMHDLLHGVEFQCFPRLLRLRADREEEARDELEHCVIDLEASLNHLQAVRARTGLAPEKTGWIERYEQAVAIFQEAAEAYSPKRVRSGCMLLSHVLGMEPGRINGWMHQLAELLDFSPLMHALVYAEKRLQRGGLETVRLAQIQDSIESLRRLETAVRGLVAEHDRWQSLDSSLRLIGNSLQTEATTPRGLEELEVLWPEISATTRTLVGDAAGGWTVKLTREAARLSELLAASVSAEPTNLAVRFRAYRRLVAERFYQIDANLRSSLGELGRVGEPLQLLLRALEP